MPELPEVETIKNRLQAVVTGKQIIAMEVHHPKSFQGDVSTVIGSSIDQVSRRGKLLSFHLHSNLFLCTHLKMTGQLIYISEDTRVGGGHPSADWVVQLPSRHTRITLTFADQSQLFFNDMRLFGWMKVFTIDQLKTEQSKLGPDIIDPAVTADFLYTKLQRRSVPIKVALMNSQIVAGVGNIYACDALNLARISPFRPANSLSKAETAQLLNATQEVIELGIALQGTTFDGQYVTADGLAGGYQERVLTYGRAGLPCYNCGTRLVKEKLSGRGTYFCAVCQV